VCIILTLSRGAREPQLGGDPVRDREPELRRVRGEERPELLDLLVGGGPRLLCIGHRMLLVLKNTLRHQLHARTGGPTPPRPTMPRLG